jgi:hypothetical protein
LPQCDNFQTKIKRKEQIMNKTGKTGMIAIVIGIALVFAFTGNAR